MLFTGRLNSGSTMEAVEHKRNQPENLKPFIQNVVIRLANSFINLLPQYHTSSCLPASNGKVLDELGSMTQPFGIMHGKRKKSCSLVNAGWDSYLTKRPRGAERQRYT